tara:strand:+ start:79 stop:405 length:327 start_codon:yes stop_codon:yes gene_type:complete
MKSQVFEFISEYTGTSVNEITLDTLINDELGVDGDDGDELLLEFSKRFNVDLDGIEKVYFGPEGINPFTLIFHAVKAFIDGYRSIPETYSPLPVSVLVNSAKSGVWEH